MTYRVGFLTSHPIQYQAPVFRELARMPELDFEVFFCQIPDARAQGDGFGVEFAWDVPLLEGYRSTVLRNVAARPSVTAYDGCDTPEIVDKIRDGGFDAFVVNGWVVKSCLQALRGCRRYRVPCIVRGEANLLRPRAWWKRLGHRWLLSRYAAALYIGEANREFYRQGGLQDSQLFPARYCVDNSRFAAAAAEVTDRKKVREQWGLDPSGTVFLFSGKLIEKKHPLELLIATQRAIQAGAKFEVLIVGDGELRQQCEAMVRSAQLPVRFAGFLNQSKIVEAYVAADCLVLPSDHGETWGLVVNEAMACGRPAIVSDLVGCARDLVTTDVTGMVFPFGDWDALADCLRRFSEAGPAAAAMGAAARERIADYSPASAAAGLLQAVQAVAKPRR